MSAAPANYLHSPACGNLLLSRACLGPDKLAPTTASLELQTACLHRATHKTGVAACRFGINLFTRIPLSAGTTFVGAVVYGVRKFDLVSGGRTYPPYALYYSWGDVPGFTIVPSLQQVSAASPHAQCSTQTQLCARAAQHVCLLLVRKAVRSTRYYFRCFALPCSPTLSFMQSAASRKFNLSPLHLPLQLSNRSCKLAEWRQPAPERHSVPGQLRPVHLLWAQQRAGRHPCSAHLGHHAHRAHRSGEPLQFAGCSPCSRTAEHPAECRLPHLAAGLQCTCCVPAVTITSAALWCIATLVLPLTCS